jgi:PAS domain S-box-containing protein
MPGLIEEFGRFAELFPEPMLLVSSAGHLCATNAAARRALFPAVRLTPESLILEFIEDAPQKVSDYLRACARSAQPLPGLFTFPVRDGEGQRYRCLGSAFRSRDAHQRPLVVLRLALKDSTTSRFVALNQQIEQLRTEIARRVSAERLLEEQRELLQVTLTSIGDAVIATDVEGRITFMNPVAEAHTGYDQAECLGLELDQVFDIRNEHTGAAAENPVHKVLRTGGIVGLSNHTVLVRRDGEVLPIDDSAAPICDVAGKVFGVILVFHEISESRKLQYELLRQAEALKEADRRKDEFLAVLAHELRNPLAPLRNGLQIARLKPSDDGALNRTIGMMDRQLNHLVRLVDDLMDINRVSRGVIELRRTPVSMTDVLTRSVEAVGPDIVARGHELRTDWSAQPMMVNGDPHRLTQVFSNLLTNSAKYSKDGGRIYLSAAVEGNEVVVRVRDQGIGIPPEQLEQVFEMFSQVRIHQERSEGGLGIGLSLVRTLVTMHGGMVSAHSEGVGAGSTFTVRLPLTLAQAAEESKQVKPQQHSGPPLRIVVADDNADAADSLRLLLEVSGHEIRTAANGREALALVMDFQPALVFMDVGMPDLDGVQATQRIREHRCGRDIMIVALTGWGQAQDRLRTQLAGVDRHFVKPISPRDIAEVLRLAQQRLQDHGRP